MAVRDPSDGDGCPVPGIVRVDGRRDYDPAEVAGDLDVMTIRTPDGQSLWTVVEAGLGLVMERKR